MYWLLLPPDANTGRQFLPGTSSQTGAWVRILRAAWAAIVHARAEPRY
jgi:hypothetical protein